MKLAAKIILVFLVGVLGIVSLFAWQSVQRQNAQVEEQRELHASDLVKALKPAILQAYRDGASVTIQQAVEVSTQTLTGPELRWVDGSDGSATHTKTTSRSVSSVMVTDASGKRTAISYVPLDLGGEDSGMIEVAHPMSALDRFTHDSVVASIVSLLGVAALSAMVIYFAGVRLVGRPLEKLIAQVDSIGQGNLALDPVISNHDELGRLANAISQMSHRLSEQRDTIRHTDRLGTVGTLAAGVAHELGTPLNVVSGRAELISGGKLTEQEVNASAKTIKSESDRMTTIIRQLLDFARQQTSPHVSIDLNDIVSRTSDLMRSLAKKSNVRIVDEVPDQTVRIDGDAAQIQQVMTNLLANAIGAMPGGGLVTVSLTLPLDDDRARVQVVDTGGGIESKDIDRIFEPFYTTKDVGQGTGLGLSIAYGIVREHGGEIKVDSQKGKQTTFSVYFPVLRTDDKESSQ